MLISVPASFRPGKQTKAGFSLVELSIVLVILGLLVGGVLAGKSLIRASELRKVMTQHDKYLAATLTFRDKYFALPGDMPNATQFWGVANAVPATCKTTASTGTETCNGDGDGKIMAPTGSEERARFWQHLANAGIIEGKFNGVDQYGVGFDTNVWYAEYTGYRVGGSGYFQGDYGHTLSFISLSTVPLTPEEAWNIDTKVDDGKPAKGKVSIECSGTVGTCTDAAAWTNMDANYLVTSTNKVINLVYRLQF